MRFRGTIEGSDTSATGIQVPEDVVAALGPGKRHAIRVTIGGYTYRNSVAPYGGRYMVSLSAENRKAAGVHAGDDVDVDVELDTAPREVSVPPDLQAALDAEPNAARFFGGLSYTNRLRFVLSVEDAKTPETRQRRIDKAISTLREGRT